MLFKSKRRPFLTMLFALIIILSACGGSSTLPASHTPTPTSQNSKLVSQLTQILSAYCNALKNGDSQTIFSLSVHLTPELLYQVRQETFFKNAHTNAIASCKVESVTLSTDENTATGLIVYTMGNGQVLRVDQPLVKINGIWKVVGGMGLAPQLSNKSNYAGYAVTGSQNQATTYTDVKGSWTIPSVQDCTFPNEARAAFWIGLGGFPSGNGIEQIATISKCIGSLHRYEVAYELLPARAVVIDFIKYPVSPGDDIQAEVLYIGNNTFSFTMRDFTKGWNFSTRQKQNQMNIALNSAEWITEAVPPDECSTPCNKLMPLLNFGTVNFSSCYDNSSSSSLGNSISLGPTIYQSIMVISNSDHTPKALPSNLTSNGTAFSVAWEHS